jgi:hypothetical protein
VVHDAVLERIIKADYTQDAGAAADIAYTALLGADNICHRHILFSRLAPAIIAKMQASWNA